MAIRLTLPRVAKREKRFIAESDRRRFLKLGYTESANRRFGKVVMTKRLTDWEIFEEEVRLFLKYSLGLSNVDGGYGFKLGDYQIDAVGGISKHLLIFECKSAAKAKSRPVRTLIRDLSDRRSSFLAAAKDRYGKKYNQVSIVVALRGHEPSHSEVE